MKQITELRKQGNLDQAYTLGQQKMQADPNDIWIKRAFCWVCYDFIKIAIEQNDEEAFYAKINEIAELDLDVNQESMLFQSIWWTITKWVNGNIMPIENKEQRRLLVFRLLEEIQQLPKFAPSEAYSAFAKAIHRASKEFLEYVYIMKKVDMSLLSDEDKYPTTYNDRQITPLWEQMLNSYSKCLLNLLQYLTINNMTEELKQTKYEVERHICVLKDSLSRFPNYEYTLYYLAKLMIALGNNSAAINNLMPFVRKRSKDFWVWNTLAEALRDTDPQTAMSCCCRGLLCNAQEDKKVSLHESAAIVFASCGYYSAAKKEVLTANQIRMKYWGKPITKQTVLNLNNNPEYAKAQANENNHSFYEEHLALAEQLVYADMTKPILITYVNQEKHIANFIGSDQSYGFFRYKGILKNHPQTNEVYEAAMELIDEEKFNLCWCKKFSGQNCDTPFFKRIQGFVKRIREQGFAFVENTFISPELVKTHNLQDGDAIEAVAILSRDRKKNKFSWAIHTITSCTRA